MHSVAIRRAAPATASRSVPGNIVQPCRRARGRGGNDLWGSAGIYFMATGTVKWFNTAKGYGFITPDDGDKDVFVHVTTVEDAGMPPLAEGQRINYEVESDRKGFKAVGLSAAE